MITLRVAILGLVLAALAAGCGSSGPKVVTVTSTATGSSSSTSSSTGPLTTETGSTTVTSSSTGTSSSETAPVVHIATFKSPSGNIGCMIIAGTARCDVKQRSWAPPSRPHGCPDIVDFGQGVIVGGSGAGHLVCAGDTTLDPSAKTLANNTDTVIGSFRCQSRSTGVVCTNTGDRHGFFISFEAYRIF